MSIAKSMAKYPRVGDTKRPKKNAQPGQGKPCIVCGDPTTGRADIEVNWFRGDDDQVPVCGEHLKDEKAIISAYRREEQ